LVFISHCYHESPRGERFLKHSVYISRILNGLTARNVCSVCVSSLRSFSHGVWAIEIVYRLTEVSSWIPLSLSCSYTIHPDTGHYSPNVCKCRWHGITSLGIDSTRAGQKVLDHLSFITPRLLPVAGY